MAKQTRAVKKEAKKLKPVKSTAKSKTVLASKTKGVAKIVKAVKAAPKSQNKFLKQKQTASKLVKKTPSKIVANKKTNSKVNATSLKPFSKKAAPASKKLAPVASVKKPKTLMAQDAVVATVTKPIATSKPAKPEAVAKNQVIQARSVKSGKVVIQACREIACDSAQVGSGYCRLHYIKNWKKVKNRELVLSEGHLNRFIADLVQKFPQKFLDALYKDLSTEVDFAKTVIELNLSDPAVPSDDFDSDDDDVLDEPIIGSIKKESFDDLGDY